MNSSVTIFRSTIILLSCFCGIGSYSQGPGGIGDGFGTNGPRNVLWLDAATLALANDANVTSWTDQSGNGNDLAQQGGNAVPTFRNDGLSGTYHIVRFDGTERYLVIGDNATLDGFTDGLCVFVVANFSTVDNSPRGIISKRVSSGSQQSYSLFTYTGSDLNFDVYTPGNNRLQGTSALSASTDYILSTLYNGSNMFINVQSAAAGSQAKTGIVANTTSDLIIGALNDNYGTYLDADIAEIIIYGEDLTQAERIVVENYLANKYGISIAASGNDHWSNNATYPNDLAGIGQESSTSSEATTASSSFLRISESADMDDDDWLFWAHDNGDVSTYTTSEIVTGSMQQRLAREWVVNETNDLGNVTVSFAVSDVPSTGVPAPEFYILVDTDGDANFDDATPSLMTLTGGNYEVTLDLSEGDHLAVAYVTPTPAGATGTLAFWFNSESGPQNSSSAATDGDLVDEWIDLSSNGYDAATAGNDPVYDEDNSLNFHPVVTFDGANDYLTFDITDLEGADYTLMGVVRRASGSANQFVLGSQTNAADALYVGYSSDTQLDIQNSNTASTNATVNAFDSPIKSPAIIAVNYNSTNLDLEEFRNGGSNTGSVATGVDYGATGYTGNLGRALAGNYFDGDIVELFAFSTNLSSNDYNAVVSNLAIKYGVDIGQDYVDEQVVTLWDISDNGSFSNDVTAIGYDESFGLDQRISKNAADSIVLSSSEDFTSLNSTGSRTQLSDGQFAFISNDDDPYTLDQSYNGIVNSRVDRTWRYREIGATGSVAIAIPTSLVSVNQMLVSTDPTFATGVTVIGLSTSGNHSFATYDFADGDYFTFASDASEIWYSYLSGNWNNPANWTLDGAISAAYVNPNSKYPTPGDSVVIKSGRTITANINNIIVNKLEVLGTLDLGATTGQSFTYIEGSGTIRLSGFGGLDNYPSGIDTLFYDNAEGGNVEYYGTGLTFDQSRRYNNLTINLDTNTDRAIMTGDSIYVYGNLDIESGYFQFNDNLATNNLAVEVHGNLSVNADGGIDVGTANARHELNLYSDFTNQGDVDFTNRTSQTTGSEATDGIVDVNFISPDTDQIVDLQNTTDFYRLEINKGVDDTYIVEINADDPSYFNLYGYAAQSTNSAQASTNDNACGLIYGTLKVGNDVTISPLNAGGNYSIYEGSQIWINGGTVTKTSGTAIVPYGKIRVSSGILNAPINSGVTTRDNGELTIEGGTVTMNQFRTSINGVSAQGGLIMTGGILNITGVNTSTDYYTLSLTYTGNVFNMSGGTINMSGSNSRGGIYINSSDENINVTGGVINLDVTNGNDLTITSNAPFFNMNILRSNVAGTGGVTIANGTSGTGGGLTTLNPTGLTILNDLRIDNSDGFGTEFDANGKDLNIIGSLIIENGSVVDLTGMELTFEGEGGSSLVIQTGVTLSLDTLIIDKLRTTDIVNISNGSSTALSISDLLQLDKGRFDLETFDVTANGLIILSDTVGTATSAGLLYMNGGAAQTITSTNGFVYDLEIDNANGVALTGEFGVDTLTLDAGIFDIGTSRLTSNSEIQTNGTFSSSLMIQSDGNASDGGLAYYFDGGTADPTAILYPIGTDANATTRYTPVSLDLSGIAASDDGSVQIRVSDAELQTVDLTALASNMLTYYWRVSHSDFGTTPTVDSYIFTAVDSDDPDGGATPAGLPTDFVPGKVLDGSPYTRSQETTPDISGFAITFDGSGSGFTLENANYTAGDGTTSLFTGAPEVYYSRAIDGNWFEWQLTSNWSTDAVNQHLGAQAADYPKVGDIAVVGSVYVNSIGCNPCTNSGTGRHQIRIDNTVGDVDVAEIVFDSQAGGTALNASDMSRVRVRGNITLTAGKISGTGELVQDVGTVAQTGTIVGDLGEFVEENNNGWFFWFQSVNNVTITDRFDYPIFRSFGADGRLDFSQDVTAFGALVDNGTIMSVSTNWTIDSLVQIGSNGSGTLEFPDVGNSVTLECGNLIYSDDTGNNISVVNSGTDIHRLKVNGDISLDVGTGFNLTSAAGAQVELEFGGSGSNQFDNNTGTIAELYRVIMNKGADSTNTFTINTDFNLNGSTTTAPLAMELQNGKLILNNSSINVELSDGIDFSIPSSSGLEVTQGTVTSTGADIILNGLLRVNGGTVDLETTDIEYSNTGSALIDVSSGTLDIGGQVRRATTSTSGVLKYRQSGGDVDIATDGASTTSRAAFEVLNSGSEFTITGGTFNIERGVTGDANESLELNPTTYDLTGSTITIFENLSANYGANFFNIKSNIPLNNLTIANSINLPDARVYVQPLTVNDLTINANQVLNANNLDVTINGNLTNAGTYTNTSSNTIFGGNGAQATSGAGTYTIFDFTKNGTGTTTLGTSLTLANDLRVNAGTLNMGANTISLKNDAYILSTLTNTSGNGLIFNGTSNQDLYGLSNNTVTLGTITVSNPNGIDIPDGNGYNFDLTQNLRLAGGVFNIGGSLVTMKEGSTITAVSPFSINNMVQTNSSFTDNGFVVEFFGIDADTIIFYPVGELKYTPVSFNLSAGTTAGSIRVRPANEIHPTIVDNVEPVTPPNTEIDDTQNILKYYWVVVATASTGVQGNATFFYNHADIVATQSDTSNFISGRILSNNSTWDKFLPTDFKGANQSFVVPLGAGVTFAELTGDYTAGLGSTDGLTNNIEGSLPDQLAQYETSLAGAGNYSVAANWNPLGGSPAVTDGVGPVGAQIIVRNGDDLTLNISNIRLFSTEIEAGGILRVPAGVTGVRLGNVTGSGTIVLTDTELLPTGEYSAFLACDGGALQYSGSTNYGVLSGISQIRKVIFDGTGIRTMPNNNLSVCDTLLINGPTVAFNSGRTRVIGDADTDRLEIQAGTITLSNGTILDVAGDFIMSGGTFTGQSGTRLEVTDDMNYSGGTLNWNNTAVRLNGTSEQLLDGIFTGASAFQNLRINNSGQGVRINSGSVVVKGVLNLMDGLFTTTSTETLTLSSTGSWTGATSASFVTGPMTKNSVPVASTFQFPIGKPSRYAPASIANVGTGGQNWTAEYNTSMGAYPAANYDDTDPGSGFNSLTGIQPNDRWTITSSGSNTSQIRVTYGSHNTHSDEDYLRVCVWNSTDSEWVNQGGTPTGNISSGTCLSENTISFSTNEFALGTAPPVTLPVELISFSGVAEEGRVILKWITASELNNDFFDIQHSSDGVNFESIGTVDGNGTTNELISYHLIDRSPRLGVNYYRLRQVDFDGAEEIHPLIRVDNDFYRSGIDITFYPNPASPENMNLRIQSGDDHTPLIVRIIDLTGQTFFQAEVSSSLIYDKKIIPFKRMSSGVYLIKVTQGNNVAHQKIVIK
jgi:hypothetical protein